jgi:predicted XRE-type DNA-binding protein
MANRELVTQAEFARRIGVNKSQVSLAMRSGRLKFARGTKLLDWDKSKVAWELNRSDTLAGTGRANTPDKKISAIGNLRPVKNVKDVDSLDIDHPQNDDDEDDTDTKDDTLTFQKTRKTKADAERVELRLAQEKGELIAKEDVLGVYYTILVTLKNSILATPDRIVGEVQAVIEEWKDNPAMLKTKVYEVLKVEHTRILSDIADKIAEAGTEADKITVKQLKKNSGGK